VSENKSSDGSGLAIDPKEVLHALKRRKWIIVVSTVVVAGAVVAGTMRQPKIYGAAAQIMIEPNLPKVLGNDVSIDNMAEQARAERVFNNTQYKTITSRTVIRDVIDRLQLDQDKDFLTTYELGGIKDEEALAKAIEGVLLKNTLVEPETGTRIVTLRVEDQDPMRAVKIANTLGDAYIDFTLRKRLDKTHEASKWLDLRVEEFGKRLEDAEKRLYEFKRDNSVFSVSIEDRQNMTGASLQILTEKLVETRTKIIELHARRQVVQQLLQNSQADPSEIPEVAESEVVGELRAALVTLDKQQAELSARYGAKHPVMVGIDQQIAKTQEQLKQEVRRVVSALDSKILAVETAQKGLEAEMAQQKEKALALNNLALDYTKLTRDFGTTKTTYEQLLKRQTEADLSGRLDMFNFVDWFQRAEPKMAPVRPSLTRNALMGLAVGLLLGLLIALAGVLLDNTVHTQAEVEELLRLPFLGLIPRIADDERAQAKEIGYNRNRDLFVVQNPKSAVAECARSVRTNLLFMGADRPLRKLLMTSAGTGEGKTTTSIGLAVTMAQAGNRVVLLDTDLRKPRLHRTFGVSGEVGITSVLVDAAKLDEAIKKTEVVGLDLLPCGPLPPNPADLLHSDRFKELLERLAGMYDRVLLDSPPVGVVTDAAILSQLVDGSLLVIQANRTTRESARRARRRLLDVEANIVGVVLNDLDIDSAANSNQYYYYRYGYGTDGEEDAKAKA
jgi:succinoglycan biosynthesis transport protein ExoP